MSKDIINDIRTGVLDVNGQELFLPLVIKGLLLSLNKSIFIRKNSVPHYIMHTGDDTMFLEQKGHDISIEPYKVSNEEWIYSIVPRCMVNPGSIDLDTAQLTSPYALGKCQIETDNEVLSLSGEFRRVPIKLSVELKYLVESYTDMMELIQYVISNLAFIRTFNIVYLGQNIICSYKIPDSFGEEHTMDLDGAFQDNRNHTLTLSLEIETNMPVFANKTMMRTDNIISNTKANIITKNTATI
jgi:hypothetical protein